MNAMYPDLAGKVAVVTGSGRVGGLGEAMARRLAAEGAKIVIHDIGQTKGDIAPAHGVGIRDEMDGIAADIRALGGEATAFAADMLVEDEVAALIDCAVTTYGRIDILVNNAGVGYMFGPLIEMTAERWNTVLNVNLRGAFFAMKHAARHMIAQGPAEGGWGAGRIVSIGSRASKSGGMFTQAYTASKHALVGLTRSAALEFAPHKINVNAICPNHVTTKLGAWQNSFMSDARGQSVDEYLAQMRARIPLGRVGLVEDTANACAFLCSGQANYITGEAMNVSGGEEYH
jgi:meso-butanediol dehydrogenase/(S,S)-butanediol dehydrogenase/diacetyl reductase